MRWFRFHTEALNDHKIQTMPAEMFRAWVNILCIASKGDGKIANNASLQFQLRKSIAETKVILDYLDGAGLLDYHDDHFVPHNWDKWQYKSDDSATRMRRHRLRKGDVTSDAPDTDTDTDTESKIVTLRVKKESLNSRKCGIPDGWVPSNESRDKATALGLTQSEVQKEAERFKNHARQNDRKAVRWDAAFDNWCIKAAEFLNRSPPSEKSGGFSALPGSPEFLAWRSFASDSGRQSLVRLLNQREMEGRAFSFESQWPPGVSNAVG